MKASDWVVWIVPILFLITGCADSVDKQLAALQQQQEQDRGRFQQYQQHREQQHAEFQRALRARNEAFARLLAGRQAAFHKRLVQIEQLPLELREAALDRLKRDEEAWHHDISEELDREARDLDHEQVIDAQRDLTDAINDLSDQIEQARMDY